MAKRLFILGSINTDLVINTPYVPQRGETLIGSGFFTARGHWRSLSAGHAVDVVVKQNNR